MAAEIESSGSDEEIVSSRRRKLSSGRKRQLFTDSGNDTSDAESPCCTKQGIQSEGRSSERIRRRHSKEFRMPDKNEYWNKIPDCHGTVESMKSLTPRKVISNLTKVYNSYNADTYDTDEDEMSEFIVEDDEIDDENSTSDGTDDDEKRHTGRIDRSRTEFSETKLHRIREISSSDSESEGNHLNNAINQKEANEESKSHTNNDTSILKSKIPSSSDEERDESVDDTLNNERFEQESGSESDDSIKHSTCSKRKRNIESSDSDSDSECKTTRRMSATTRTTERLKQRQELFRELKETRRK